MNKKTKLDVVQFVRLTAQQKDLIKKQSSQVGLTESSYIRILIDRGLKTPIIF